eukprot:g5413.t1
MLLTIAYSRLSCVSWQNLEARCFYRGSKLSIYELTIRNNHASYPVNLGGRPYKDIQCLTTGKGKIDYFFLNQANYLVYSTYRQGSWSPQWFLQKYLLSEIGRSSCVARGAEFSSCLLRSLYAYPHYYSVRNRKYSSHYTYTDKYRSAFSCVAYGSSVQYCYAAGTKNELCYRQYSGGRWTVGAYTNPGVQISSVPTAVLSSGSRHHILVTDLSYNLKHIVYNVGSGYSAPKIVGQKTLIESPECLARGSTKLYCFAVGYDHSLYRVQYDGSRWSDYVYITDQVLETPSCVWYSSTLIACFGRKLKSTVFQVNIKV